MCEELLASKLLSISKFWKSETCESYNNCKIIPAYVHTEMDIWWFSKRILTSVVKTVVAFSSVFSPFCFINYKLPFIINLVCDSSLLNCVYDDTYSSSIFCIILQKLDYKIVLQFKEQSPKPLYFMCIYVCNTLKICFYSDTSYSL